MIEKRTYLPTIFQLHLFEIMYFCYGESLNDVVVVQVFAV